MKRLQHGMLLDAKSVMDDAMPDLEAIRELVPECLHDKLDNLIRRFEDTLCEADAADRYTEIERTR